MRERLEGRIRTGSLVCDLRRDGEGYLVRYLDLASGKVTALHSRAVIFAAPRFTAPYLVDELRRARPAYLESFEYSPWMVANITLSGHPDGGGGAELAWDNVFFDSRSLGYFVATHQEPGLRKMTVLTYYLPLSWESPREARQSALARSHAEWCEMILADLSKPHPRIADQIENIDVWLWGHGMIQPRTGFIFGAERQAALRHEPPLFYAHSDMSGISIFEEAQYRGVTAAQEALAHLGAANHGEAPV
jgi:hypothetical protein